MNAEELKQRTKKFAVDLIEYVKELPQHGPIGAVTRQLLDAGTSIAANYRASCRARSRAEFNAKMGVVAEEADETVYWLEVLIQSGVARGPIASTLLDEARQLRAIMAASAATAPRNYAASKSNDTLAKSPKRPKSPKSPKSITKSPNPQIKK